jgi:hypothetical protein
MTAPRGTWLVLLVACVDSKLPVQPLPDLVTERAPRAAAAIDQLRLTAGERMIWDVYVHGLVIGRAELIVDDNEIRSDFATRDLAKALFSVHHALTTVLARTHDRAERSVETLVLDGATTRGELPAGDHVQTIHTVLGWLRAWARPGAPPGFLTVATLGELYRFEVAGPTREALESGPALRVECRVVGAKTGAIALTIWLAEQRALVPVRIQIAIGELHVIANLVDYHVE